MRSDAERIFKEKHSARELGTASYYRLWKDGKKGVDFFQVSC